jgi:flagellar biosynthesis/type III secretory pathway protein FliH
VDTAVDWTWKELPGNGANSSGDPEVTPEELELQTQAALEEAYRRGLAEGITRGQAEARQELAAALSVARQAVDQVRAEQAEWMANLDESLAAVAVGAARLLVEQELATDHQVIERLIARALTQFPREHKVKVRVNPDDLQRMGEADPGAAEGGREARWIGDPSIQPGDFLVEGPERLLDGRLDKALERLYRSMANV